MSNKVKNSYYYLIASLPDLIFEGIKNPLSYSEIVSEIITQVYPSDAEKIKAIIYHFDNKNLLTILEKDKISFDTRGVFSKEELVQEIKKPIHLPIYMKKFLQAYNGEKFSTSDLLSENQLSKFYYEEMIQHPNKFLREWFGFNLDLRNIISGLNIRKLKVDLEDHKSIFSLKKMLICKNSITEKILKSEESDFSLSFELPWIEQLLSLENCDLVKFEQGVDNLRWEKVNELTLFSYFHIENILAFIIKLEIVTRWQNLDFDLGEITLRKLLTEMKTGYDIEHQFL
jgi:hypothetical protein